MMIQAKSFRSNCGLCPLLKKHSYECLFLWSDQRPEPIMGSEYWGVRLLAATPNKGGQGGNPCTWLSKIALTCYRY